MCQVWQFILPEVFCMFINLSLDRTLNINVIFGLIAPAIYLVIPEKFKWFIMLSVLTWYFYSCQFSLPSQISFDIYITIFNAISFLIPRSHEFRPTTRFKTKTTGFSVEIAKAICMFYFGNFFARTFYMWKSLPVCFLPAFYNFLKYKCKVNRHLCPAETWVFLVLSTH